MANRSNFQVTEKNLDLKLSYRLINPAPLRDAMLINIFNMTLIEIISV